jgi:selT/selW/selH-like putative selenoprotein
MSILIEYCGSWGHEPQALRVKAELEKRGITDVQMKRSSGGVFNVYVDGMMRFSRHETGRYPLPDDIDGFLNKSAWNFRLHQKPYGGQRAADSLYAFCPKAPVNGCFAQAQIAQLVEQRIENPRVAGSNPALGTKIPSIVTWS